MKIGLVPLWGAAALAAAAPAQTVVSSSETAVTAAGPETVLAVAVEGGYLYGYSQYEIKGDDPFWGSWKSRLKWPLDTAMTGGSARLALEDDTFEFGVSFLFNVTDDPGNLEDWDWVGGEAVSKGVVDTSLTAYLLDCYVYWNMVKKERFTLGLGLGYAWQHFSWDGEGELTQTEYDCVFNRYYGITPGTYRYPDAEWITYKIDYYLPYLGVKGKYRFDPRLEASAYGKLMLLIARDEDDHVQRMKKSDADYYGAGMEYGLEGLFLPAPWAQIALSFKGTFLSGSGDQDQEFYGGIYEGEKYSNIDADATSIQWYAGLRAGVVF